MHLAPFSPVILKHLNTPWRKVAHLGMPVAFAPKSIMVISPDSGLDGFYFITKGVTRLSYLAASGQDKVLFYLGQDSFFNEIPAMGGSTDCIFTFMTQVEAVFFKTCQVTSPSFVSQYPDLMINWLHSISLKCSSFSSQVCSAGLLDSFSNVCRLLYSMVIYNVENGKIIPYLTQQEFASLLGIHRGSLHKAFTRLREEGILGSYNRKELIIHDVEKLKRYLVIEK